MLQTLVYIPDRLFGLPLFGFGLLLAVWGVATAAILGFQWVRWGKSGRRVCAGVGDVRPYHLAAPPPAGRARSVRRNPRLADPRLRRDGHARRRAGGRAGGASCGQAAVRPRTDLFARPVALHRRHRRARAFYVIEYWHDQFLAYDAAGNINWLTTLGNVVNIPKGVWSFTGRASAAHCRPSSLSAAIVCRCSRWATLSPPA